MRFSRQEYWSGLPFPSPGDLPNPGIEARSPALQADAHVQLCDPTDCVAYQAPMSMGFPRQECWSGLPFPSPGGLPDPGTKPASAAWQAGSSPLSHVGSPRAFWVILNASWLPWWLNGKESACNAGGHDSIPGLGRSPGEGNGNPFQYFCLKNSMERGAWQAIFHRVTKSQTQRGDSHTNNSGLSSEFCLFHGAIHTSASDCKNGEW